MSKRVLIMGAAGRDFHNFNVHFRGNTDYKVIAFTATQIPNIDGRRYPAALAGKLYPEGIPIYPEAELKNLIVEHKVELVVFSYSDVSHEYVMHKASEVLSSGADYMLLGPASTMLKSTKPVIAVGAVRTGCGKSQTTRKVSRLLKDLGKNVVIVRHPMAYGNLDRNRANRYASLTDLSGCTLEEREEYEPHIRLGNVVYGGVDYADILRLAEKECDIILWDGGNNDFPFYEPDLFIVVVDPLRVGDEVLYNPGETCLRMANVVVINKVDTASADAVIEVERRVRSLNPGADVIKARSPIFVDKPELISGKRVIVVEDGPTLTHGGMGWGAGYLAAQKYGAKSIIDPRGYAIGSIRAIYDRYETIGAVLPAMGYGDEQLRELSLTINNSGAQVVIGATPVDLSKIIEIKSPYAKVWYELEEVGRPDLKDTLDKWLNR